MLQIRSNPVIPGESSQIHELCQSYLSYRSGSAEMERFHEDDIIFVDNCSYLQPGVTISADKVSFGAVEDTRVGRELNETNLEINIPLRR